MIALILISLWIVLVLIGTADHRRRIGLKIISKLLKYIK